MFNCEEKRHPEKLSAGSLRGTLWTLCRQFPSRCQFVDQLTALGAYLKHYLLNSWKCLCCVFVRKWCALCISKEPSTQKRCCVQPICWPIYPSQKGILFLVTQNINLRNQTTILAEPIHIQKNQNLDQWNLATKHFRALYSWVNELTPYDQFFMFVTKLETQNPCFFMKKIFEDIMLLFYL